MQRPTTHSTQENLSKDPYIADKAFPVPNELTLEVASGTPNYANESSAQSPIQAAPIGTPIQGETNVPQSHFVEDLDVSLKQWTFGVSWQRTNVTKAGILNKLIGKKQLIDLDLACLMVDSQGQILERVWFKNVRDKAESIRHRGDSLDGTDRGDNLSFDNRLDQERIDVYLDKIPPHVQFIGFVLSSFHGQAFADISEGYCHISDDEGNDIMQLNLPKLPKNCKSIWVATLARELNTWQFIANKQPLTYHCLAQFEQQIQQFLEQMQHIKTLQPA